MSKDEKDNVEKEKVLAKDFFIVEDKVEGKRLFVRKGDSYEEKTTTESLAPSKYYSPKQYDFKDLLSFMEYCKKYGDDKKGVIFYNSNGITMFFDENNREESIKYAFGYSHQLMSFLGGLGEKRQFTQKEFFKCLGTYPECLEAKDLVYKIKNLKISATVEIRSEIGEADHTFLYQEKTGKQTCSIPKDLILNLPYFKGSAHNLTLNVALEVIRPQSAEDKVLFILENTYRVKALEAAIKLEIDHVKTELPKWSFFFGTTK